MHSRASTLYGATMAWVGQASMHAVQVPQWLVAVVLAGSDVGKGRSV